MDFKVTVEKTKYMKSISRTSRQSNHIIIGKNELVKYPVLRIRLFQKKLPIGGSQKSSVVVGCSFTSGGEIELTSADPHEDVP